MSDDGSGAVVACLIAWGVAFLAIGFDDTVVPVQWQWAEEVCAVNEGVAVVGNSFILGTETSVQCVNRAKFSMGTSTLLHRQTTKEAK